MKLKWIQSASTNWFKAAKYIRGEVRLESFIHAMQTNLFVHFCFHLFLAVTRIKPTKRIIRVRATDQQTQKDRHQQ